jgi:RNA polymerase sigma factor (TIGR02999 family)
MPAVKEFLGATALKSRSGRSPGRPSEAVSMNDVTSILSAIELGDPHAASQLLPLVYDELRKLAAQRLAREKPGQTLQATALVHEAYLRLVGDGQPRDWNGRGHFFAAAAEAMRRILINRARDKHRLKRHRQRARVDLEAITDPATTSDADLLELDDALGRLAGTSAQAAELVKLRFFAGLTLPEAAAALGLPNRSADRLWAFARAWLIDALDPE